MNLLPSQIFILVVTLVNLTAIVRTVRRPGGQVLIPLLLWQLFTAAFYATLVVDCFLPQTALMTPESYTYWSTSLRATGAIAVTVELVTRVQCQRECTAYRNLKAALDGLQGSS